MKPEKVVEVLQMLWPEGIRPLDYIHVLRVVRLIGDLPDETKAGHGVSPTSDGYRPTE